MGTTTSPDRLLLQVERLRRSGEDDRSLRLALLAGIRRLLPFDAYV